MKENSDSFFTVVLHIFFIFRFFKLCLFPFDFHKKNKHNIISQIGKKIKVEKLNWNFLISNIM